MKYNVPSNVWVYLAATGQKSPKEVTSFLFLQGRVRSRSSGRETNVGCFSHPFPPVSPSSKRQIHPAGQDLGGHNEALELLDGQ